MREMLVEIAEQMKPLTKIASATITSTFIVAYYLSLLPYKVHKQKHQPKLVLYNTGKPNSLLLVISELLYEKIVNLLVS